MDKFITLKQAKPEVQCRFMTGVYLRMMFALAITGAIAYAIAYCYDNNITLLLGMPFKKFYKEYFKVIFWTCIIAEFIVVIGFSSIIRKVSPFTALLMLVLYAVLNGITFSSVFLHFEKVSIEKIFLVTCLMFLGMSIYGAITKSDLRSAGRIFMMALLGVIITGFVNILFKSEILDWILSIVGVVIFVGLTAYDTQKLLKLSIYDDGSNSFKKFAVLGALELYLDFINIFTRLLFLFGRKKEDN